VSGIGLMACWRSRVSRISVERRFYEAPNVFVKSTTCASQKRSYNSRQHLGNTP
jgi:hypothetical protein